MKWWWWWWSDALKLIEASITLPDFTGGVSVSVLGCIFYFHNYTDYIFVRGDEQRPQV